MKTLVLILFCTFVLQSDTIKVDTMVIQQVQVVYEKFNIIDTKLDSLIAILEDTITHKKQKR